MNNPLSASAALLGRTVLVTGTDTDVGKTYATAALAVAGWYAGRRRIAVYKPQQTGMRGEDPGDVHDVARLALAAGVPSAALTVAEGQRLTEPMAPPPAAAIDGVELLPLTAHVRKIVELQETHDLVLVEGSGGVLVELDGQRHTIADLAVAVQELAPQETADQGATQQREAAARRGDVREERAATPAIPGPASVSVSTVQGAADRDPSPGVRADTVEARRGATPVADRAPVSTVLVARPDLGTLNHTLLSLEALLHRGVHVAGVVLGSWPGDPDRLQESNRDYLADLPEIRGERIPLLGAVPRGWGASGE